MFLSPLDGCEVALVEDVSYPKDVPLNKLCAMAEIKNPEWKKALRDLDLYRKDAPFHRKAWEFAQAVYGLRKLKRLLPEAVALGVGSGHEPILYFLANKIAKVIATDLYEGSFAGHEGSAYMLDHPDMFAPFHYRRNHLQVLAMDGRMLDFPSESFDFVFSFSSIEHFGGHEEAAKALKEMFRVLKPGGIAAITTELILNRLGKASGFFRRREIEPLFLEATGFQLVGEEIDDRIEQRFVSHPMDFPYEAPDKPCIVLRRGLALFTSISLFLQKPVSAEAPQRVAAIGDERPHRIRRFVHKAEIISPVIRLSAQRGELIRVPLTLRNLGDVTWYDFPSQTHTVRVGAHLLSSSGECLQWDFARQDLPVTVSPDDQTRVDFIVRAPHRRGDFVLEIDLVKEGVLWFGEAASPTLRVRLGVE